MKDLLSPRYKVIDDYPGNEIPIDTVLYLNKFDNWTDGKYFEFKENPAHFDKYPHLFRKLHWAEERLLDDLMSVKFVEITIYTGYWVVGDIVPVSDYEIDTKNKKLVNYRLGGSQYSKPENCKPATTQQYLDWKIKNKIS